MFKTLDGIEWINPIILLPINNKSKIRFYGDKAYCFSKNLNSIFKTLDPKIKYKSAVIDTDKGVFIVYTNFTKGCPIFLPLKDNRPYIKRYLSSDGFRIDAQVPENLDEILLMFND